MKNISVASDCKNLATHTFRAWAIRESPISWKTSNPQPLDSASISIILTVAVVCGVNPISVGLATNTLRSKPPPLNENGAIRDGPPRPYCLLLTRRL
jgi:hypothetical protein